MKKLFKSKKGFAPLVWAFVVVAGLFGASGLIGKITNIFAPQKTQLFLGLPMFGWVIIALLLFIIIIKTR